MGKSAIESTKVFTKALRSAGAADGLLLPANPQISGTLHGKFDTSDGLMVPTGQSRPKRALLDGNVARRKLPLRTTEYCIWDTELKGFGLRVRPSGKYLWFVRVRHRDKQRRYTLGSTEELDAVLARSQARRLLAEVALDGLPKRVVVKATPTMDDFVETYWPDLARGWKPRTVTRNMNAWKLQLKAPFGACRVADITRADVVRWRDGCAGESEAQFNRAVPVLASLMKYAEALHLRRKGSNPCRGISRYKREAKERYLTPLEYRRIGKELAEDEAAFPGEVAIVRLLLLTGARVSEIRDLQYEWVKPPRLVLPDSKTGPKIIWLNSKALAILEAVPRIDGCPFVFPNRKRTKPMLLDPWWSKFRRRCALPDVRIHDLRHSFASAAIMDNVPLATIGKLLGHVLPETTAKYAHLADEVIADAAQRVSGSLASAIGLRQ